MVDVTFKAIEQACKVLDDPETHSKFDRESFHV
jgi:DnaJ-class molecular chaperone